VTTGTGIELLTVGRISVDLYAEQLGAPLAEVRTFRKSLGGTATNVAVAAARLGRRAAVFTKVGADAFGGYIRDALADTFHVDTRFVGTHPSLRTPLAFAELLDPGEPTVVFYREPEAPDMTIEPSEIDLEVVAQVPILWISAGALAREPSRSTVMHLLAHRARRTHTVLDLDWRPALWHDATEAPHVVRRALDHATIAIGNRTECEIAVGIADPNEAADRLLAAGMTAAVVKQGGEGVLVATSDMRERVMPYEVKVVCGLGSGDAFGGAFCDRLLAGASFGDAVRAANAAGAIVAGRLMCADDMPTQGDITEMMRGDV
jgi:5-dehydro-2-deoxygluconokinase